MACPPNSREKIQILHATLAEVDTPVLACHPLFTSSSVQYFLDFDWNGVNWNNGMEWASPAVSNSQIYDGDTLLVSPDPFDLVAVKYVTENNGGTLSSQARKMILKHDLNVTQDTVLPLDFDNAEEVFDLEPQVIDLIGVGSDAINAQVQFYTARGANIELGWEYGHDPHIPFSAVPVENQTDDDMIFAFAEAYPPGTGTDRIAGRHFKDGTNPDNLKLTFPPYTFSSPQVNLSTAEGFLHVQANWLPYEGPVHFYRLALQTRWWSALISPGWLGTEGPYTYHSPDFSMVEGWNPLYEDFLSGDVLWSLDAYHANRNAEAFLSLMHKDNVGLEGDSLEWNLAGKVGWIAAQQKPGGVLATSSMT